jgi:predicted RecB family endonuclease
LGLIREFSDPTFTRALGRQGEMLADAGFARVGFRIRQENVRNVGEREWTETNHDLDRLIERDGERYGVEIKNTLGYIDRTEFQVKLGMCLFLGVKPMFVARMMPKTYIKAVIDAGGFCLILGNQHYPLMADDLAVRVRASLNLPVLSIRGLPDSTLSRFEGWHERALAKRNKG